MGCTRYESQVVKGSHGKKRNTTEKMNVMEAFQLFREENQDVDVGKSKFFEFRPQHIQPMANILHNVCICQQYGNMDSLLQGICKVYSKCPNTGRELIDSLVFQRNNPSCMMITCTVFVCSVRHRC